MLFLPRLFGYLDIIGLSYSSGIHFVEGLDKKNEF